MFKVNLSCKQIPIKLALLTLILNFLNILACFDYNDKTDAGAKAATGSVRGRVLLSGITGSAAIGRYKLKKLRDNIANAREQQPSNASKDTLTLEEINRADIRTNDTPNYSFENSRFQNKKDKLPPLKQKKGWAPGEIILKLDADIYTKSEKADYQKALEYKLREALQQDIFISMEHCIAKLFCYLSISHSSFESSNKKVELINKEETTIVQKILDAKPLKFYTYASRNFYLHGMKIPNDNFYPTQSWHYEAMNLPQAWDITTGNDNIVIAVIDSGLNLGHPDIEGRVLQGYDFVRDPNISFDNDGWDNNPFDSARVFHGTHVAGTIAAETNNNEGVAGVTWQGKILPVRVLGNGLSGTTADGVAGMLWAAGLVIDGVPANQSPAKVINMSFGGGDNEETHKIWDDAINEITGANAQNYNNPILVVAAGNANENAEATVPANIESVIAVGAHRFDGQRAFYSNFGDVVDIMAPGGQADLDQNFDGFNDQILSLFDNDYQFQQGTSMACPHVSGVVALMLSLQPNLNVSQVKNILFNSANTDIQCAEGCGAGRIDALAALQSMGGAVPAEAKLSVNKIVLQFSPKNKTSSIQLSNLGAAILNYEVSLLGDDASKFQITQTQGQITAQNSKTLQVQVKQNANTRLQAQLKISGLGTASNQSVTIILVYRPEELQQSLPENIEVAAYKKLETGQFETAGTAVVTNINDLFRYELTDLPQGKYYIYAISDDNRDGIFDSKTESLSAWPTLTSAQTVTVIADQRKDNIDFALTTLFKNSMNRVVGKACTTDNQCSGIADGTCLDQQNDGFVAGYCTRRCDDNYCGNGASCEQVNCGNSRCGICLATCNSNTDCRVNDGYVCDAFSTCVPNGF